MRGLGSFDGEHDFLGCRCRCQGPWTIDGRAHQDCISLDRDTPILCPRGFLQQDLGGECLVVFEPYTPPAIVGDRDAVAGGLRELDAVPDDGLEVAPVEVMPDVVGHRLREGRPA